MGCEITKFCSRGDEIECGSNEKGQGDIKQYSWDKNRAEVDVTKYTIDGVEDGEDGRLPGTVDGQQFQIKNCINSQIYVFDWSNTVTIDDCKNCKVFIGPVKGSVFVRDCSNCVIVVACGQFRTRDCTNLDIFLAVNTQPIIESSRQIRVGCFQFNYPGIEDHLFQADISQWDNFWWKVHDFTPEEGGGRNWSRLGAIFKIDEFMPLPTKQQFQSLNASMNVDKSVIPLTRGPTKMSDTEECCLLVIFHTESQISSAWKSIEAARGCPGVNLVRINFILMRKEDGERLLPNCQPSRIAAGKILVLLLEGAGSQSVGDQLSKEVGDLWISKANAKKDSQGLFGLAEMNLGF